MLTAAFDYVIKFNRFFLETQRQISQRLQQLRQAPETTQANSGGDGVVGGLGHVDMVVRVDRFVGSIQWIIQYLVGAIGDDCVDVHVVAGTSAGLNRVYHELILETAVYHFIGCLSNGLGDGRA
jgi:hypothetical protein